MEGSHWWKEMVAMDKGGRNGLLTATRKRPDSPSFPPLVYKPPIPTNRIAQYYLCLLCLSISIISPLVDLGLESVIGNA